MINPGMLKKIKKMQEDMVKAQQEINNATFYGTAGGGLVDVAVKGTKEVVNVKINADSLDKDDLEILEDSLVAALNDAFKKVDKETEETMGQFTAGVPGMGGLF